MRPSARWRALCREIMPAGRTAVPSHQFLPPDPFLAAGRSTIQGITMINIRPLHDRIIVKRLDEEKKTASGIVIPETAAEKPDQGEVMAVGSGRRSDNGVLIPLDIRAGDRVLFGKYSGQTVRVKGDELLVMREDDVMGVVEGQP
jgi:chaperonin GroES